MGISILYTMNPIHIFFILSTSSLSYRYFNKYKSVIRLSKINLYNESLGRTLIEFY